MMSKYNASREMTRRSLEVMPPEIAGEHPAIDSLRSVANMARTTACLLDDARIYGQIPDEQEYAQFRNRRARRGKTDALGCGRCAAGDD